MAVWAATALLVLALCHGATAPAVKEHCGAPHPGEHVLLQRTQPQLFRRERPQLLRPEGAELDGGARGGLCRTATRGDKCYRHVMWAKKYGVRYYPSWYPGLSHSSRLEDFQRLLHARGTHGDACPEPCAPDAKPFALEGCQALSKEQCCGHRDGRPKFLGQDCVVVRSATALSRDVERPCQPEAWVAADPGLRVDCPGRPAGASAGGQRASPTPTTTDAAAATTSAAQAEEEQEEDPDTPEHRMPSMCAAFGDPHFITFDGGHTVLVGGRVFWLVKTENVWIQGLSRDSEGKLMGVAVGGPFMRGHRLVLTNTGNSTLSAEFDAGPILSEEVDEFHQPRVMEAVREEKWEAGLHSEHVLKLRTEHAFDIGPWSSRFLRPPRGGVFLFHFREGVEVTATGVDYMSVVISMPPQPGGHAGFCGNYNGSPQDDAEPVVPSWNRPLGPGLEPVPEAQSLFLGLPEGSVEGAAPQAGAPWRRRRRRPSSVRRQLLRRVLRLRRCPWRLREAALQRCGEVSDARIRRDCIFDVCTTGNASASDGAVAAEALRAEVVEAEGLAG